jgi:hypothetical protein
VAEGYLPDRHVETDYPPFDEEYFEWIDLLEAITSAKGQFTMLELGGGWGRWTANAATALRHLGGLPHTLVVVEAESTHFQLSKGRLTPVAMVWYGVESPRQ